MGCGCSGSTNSSPRAATRSATGRNAMKDVFDSEEFVLAEYLGPGSVKLIPSPSGILTKFNLTDYGLGKKGAIIKVHKKDVEEYPQLFRLIKVTKDDTLKAQNEELLKKIAEDAELASLLPKANIGATNEVELLNELVQFANTLDEKIDENVSEDPAEKPKRKHTHKKKSEETE